MQYVIVFLEGIITFISPCLLPMLPVYLSFFAGENPEEGNNKALPHSIAFVAGFSTVFILLGAFAGTLGSLLTTHKLALNLITGAIVIVFGLNFLGVIHIKPLNATRKANMEFKTHSLFSSFLFGIIFSIGWTPCVGAFLGSALMLASSRGSMLQGIFMLLLYSLGLGIPFVLSAILIERLKNTFIWIKLHYKIITRISGILLIIVGLSMMLGLMDRLLSILSI